MMANLSIINILTNRVADIYIKLKIWMKANLSIIKSWGDYGILDHIKDIDFV